MPTSLSLDLALETYRSGIRFRRMTPLTLYPSWMFSHEGFLCEASLNVDNVHGLRGSNAAKTWMDVKEICCRLHKAVAAL